MANPISRYYLKRKGEREKKNSNIRVLKKSYREVSYIRICFKIGKKKKKERKNVSIIIDDIENIRNARYHY